MEPFTHCGRLLASCHHRSSVDIDFHSLLISYAQKEVLECAMIQ